MPLWKAIGSALDRPASLAPSLVQKESSNCAESFMAVASKYVEGKRKNFGQRYMYRLRMAAAVFSYNEASFWAIKALELIEGISPGIQWQMKANEAIRRKNKKKTYVVRKPLKIPQLGLPNFEYGENPQDQTSRMKF